MLKYLVSVFVISCGLFCGTIVEKENNCEAFNKLYNADIPNDSLEKRKIKDFYSTLLAENKLFCEHHPELDRYFVKTGVGFYDFFFDSKKGDENIGFSVNLLPFKKFGYYRLTAKGKDQDLKFTSKRVTKDYLVFSCPGANLFIDKRNKMIVVFALLYQTIRVDESALGAIYLVDENLMPYLSLKREDFESKTLVLEKYSYTDESEENVFVSKIDVGKELAHKMNLDSLAYYDILKMKELYDSETLISKDTCVVKESMYYAFPMWMTEHSYTPFCKQ